jgi:hypothetical protein
MCPLRCKAIASARLKNDKVDAATLAQLLRADLLPEAWIAPPAVRPLRSRSSYLLPLRELSDRHPPVRSFGWSQRTACRDFIELYLGLSEAFYCWVPLRVQWVVVGCGTARGCGANRGCPKFWRFTRTRGGVLVNRPQGG